MAIIMCTVLFLTSNMKKIPSKKQSLVELFYTALRGLSDEHIGKKNRDIIPFVGTLIIFIFGLNAVPLIALDTPTQDLSVTAAFACIAFVTIQAYGIYKTGIRRYFKGYLEPMAYTLPFNLMERAILPISLALRLFGNILAGVIIVDLVYSGLGKLSMFATIGIPVPLHMYFDIFEGLIQTGIFVLITMINLGHVCAHEE